MSTFVCYCRYLNIYLLGGDVMKEVKKTLVRIGGREYMMKGVESEEYIHKVAIYVDKKISEVSKYQPNLSTSMTVVLTAINLADEVIRLKEQVELMESQINEMKNVFNKSASPTLLDARKSRPIK